MKNTLGSITYKNFPDESKDHIDNDKGYAGFKNLPGFPTRSNLYILLSTVFKDYHYQSSGNKNMRYKKYHCPTYTE